MNNQTFYTELVEVLPYFLFILGVFGRVFLPWLNARRSNPDLPWSWRMIWPQLVTGLIVLIVAPLITGLEALGSLKPVAAYLSGWAAADVGREIDKFLRPPAPSPEPVEGEPVEGKPYPGPILYNQHHNRPRRKK